MAKPTETPKERNDWWLRAAKRADVRADKAIADGDVASAAFWLRMSLRAWSMIELLERLDEAA
jgi:hypothetical protein